MIYDWRTELDFGMFRGCYLHSVKVVKPSYLVWITTKTSRQFSEEVMAFTRQYVAEHRDNKTMSPELIKEFEDKHCGGPW